MTGVRVVWALLALAVAGQGCTDAELKAIITDDTQVFDDKLSVQGKVCTTDPSDVIFPLKVLFIIDTSQSMNINDPVSTTEPDPTKQTGRARAIRDVVARYVNLKASYLPARCNTGTTGCAKGSTSCPTCGAPNKFMCIGPDCCKGGTRARCRGVPPCKTTGFNGTCVSLCDAKKTPNGCPIG